jgi:predicted Zn-dependent protease
MAHVTQRHGLRKLIAAGGPNYVLRLFVSDRQGVLSVISSGSQLLVGQQYSRGMEHDADTIGWHYLMAANIDSRGLVDFFNFRRRAKPPPSSPKCSSAIPPTANASLP